MKGCSDGLKGTLKTIVVNVVGLSVERAGPTLPAVLPLLIQPVQLAGRPKAIVTMLAKQTQSKITGGPTGTDEVGNPALPDEANGGASPTIPQTDEEAQQIATSRALATAKDILLKGGTQAEAAEAAKAVARQILKEFQLAKQMQQIEEVQLAEIEPSVVSSKTSLCCSFIPPL